MNMTTQVANSLQAFQWERQPQAAKFVWGLVESFLATCQPAAKLAQRMRDQTGTRFYDWVGHIALDRRDSRLKDLNAVGYAAFEDLKSITVFTHEGGIFPTILVTDGDFEIGIKVESVADFLAANQLEVSVEGEPLADVRRAVVATTPGHKLVVIERHGSRSFERAGATPKNAIKRLVQLEKFRTRQRDCESDEQGFEHANKLIDAAIADLGVDLTCDLWFAAEREYWQRAEPRGAGSICQAREAGIGLGESRSSHVSIIATELSAAGGDVGEAGVSLPRAVLCGARGGVGRAGDGAACGRDHDLQRRRSFAR
jgi:hypothetical protein